MKTQKTVTFIPEGKHFRVLETGDLCSLPIIGEDVTIIENYSVGIGHSAHANIDETGSVKGMKELGYWQKSDHIIKARVILSKPVAFITTCQLLYVPIFSMNYVSLLKVTIIPETRKHEK